MAAEFPCTCTGLDAHLERKCFGCVANARVREAGEAATRRCVEAAVLLQKNSTCKTVRKTCQYLIDRFLKDVP